MILIDSLPAWPSLASRSMFCRDMTMHLSCGCCSLQYSVRSVLSSSYSVAKTSCLLRPLRKHVHSEAPAYGEISGMSSTASEISGFVVARNLGAAWLSDSPKEPTRLHHHLVTGSLENFNEVNLLDTRRDIAWLRCPSQILDVLKIHLQLRSLDSHPAFTGLTSRGVDRLVCLGAAFQKHGRT